MNEIIKDIRNNMPNEIDGFSIKKIQKIYIPYKEIGIECLIQNISEINLFFETILKLMDIGINDIKDISYILGVEENILTEAVSDMAINDYISISKKRLKITTKGEKILRDRKSIEIRKQNINTVMVNLITGEIFDKGEQIFKEIDNYDICLNEEIEINKDFLDLNFDLVNKVFQEQQDYNNKIYNNSNVKKELSKIVDINYQKLVYLEKEVYVYKNDNSNEIQLYIKSDNKENVYRNCLYKQIAQGTYPSLDRFFTNKSYKDINFDCKVDENLDNQTKKITNMLYDSNIDIDKINEIWATQKRYLISDREFINYFVYSDKISFDKIVIYTNNIKNILSEQICNKIIEISKSKYVIIIYDKDEYGSSSIIKKFLKDKVKSKSKLIIKEGENIKDTFIFFDPLFFLKIEEYFIEAFNRAISYNRGTIEFNNSQNVMLDKIIKEYEIDNIINQYDKKQNEKHKRNYKNKGRNKRKSK